MSRKGPTPRRDRWTDGDGVPCEPSAWLRGRLAKAARLAAGQNAVVMLGTAQECDRCGAPATVTLTYVSSRLAATLRLCATCADKERGR